MTVGMFTLASNQRHGVGALSALLLASVAWAVVGALTKSPVPMFVLGFEGVLLMAGLTGVLLALGKFRDGPGLALALIALAIVVSTGLGLVSQQLAARQVVRSPWFQGRLALALAFAGLSAWVVLSRDRRSVGAAVRGALWLGLGLLTVAAIGLVWKVWTPQGSLMRVGAITALLVSGVGLVACVSVGINLIIQAFEYGRAESAGQPSGSPKSAAPAGQQSPGSTT